MSLPMSRLISRTQYVDLESFVSLELSFQTLCIDSIHGSRRYISSLKCNSRTTNVDVSN